MKFTKKFSIALLSLCILTACQEIEPVDVKSVSGQETTISLANYLDAVPKYYTVKYVITKQPEHGKLSGKLPNPTYISNDGFTGEDSFTVTALLTNGRFINKEIDLEVKVKVTSANSNDTDGDFVLNNEDAFPDKKSEIYDTDGDGIGNFSQKDEDGDGVFDIEDDFPFDGNKSQYTNTAESEFNDNITDATKINSAIPFALSGAISQNVDADMYAFEIVDDRSVSILLTHQSQDFNPIISVFDSTGTPITAMAHKLNSDSHYGYTIEGSKAGTYYLEVRDLKSRHSIDFNYTADVFYDSDFDLISDDRETALGSNKLFSDSDQDGITDFYELELSQSNSLGFDIDSDGVPNWFDSDSDGNSVSDKVEGDKDTDKNGVPDFLDLDNDNNALSDIDEIGNAVPVDTDNDGVADFSDLDDDNDWLPDVADTERLKPLIYSDDTDVDNRLFLGFVNVISNGNEVDSLLIQGKKVHVLGDGFNQADSLKVVLLADNGSQIVSNITVTDKKSLSFIMPNIEATSMFIVKNGLVRSSTANVKTVSQSMPIISDSQLTVTATDTAIIRGENFNLETIINANGKSITPSSVTNNEITFTVPHDVSSGKWFVINDKGNSNKIKVSVSKKSNAQIIFPVDFPTTVENTVMNRDYEEFTIDENGNSFVTFDKDKIGFIGVNTKWNDNEDFSLKAVTLPTTSNVEISLASTAIAEAVHYSIDFHNNLTESEALEVLEDIANLEEVALLESLIAENIVNNPLYINSSNPEYFEAKKNAVIKVNKLVSEKVSQRVKQRTNQKTANSNIQKSNSRATQRSSSDISAPTIYDYTNYGPIDLFATKAGGVYTGNVTVDNDTKLYLATKIRDLKTNKIIYETPFEYLNGDLISPQKWGSLSVSEETSLKQCDFVDCKVFIMRTGMSDYRSFSEGVTLPTINFILGLDTDYNQFVSLLLTHAPTVLDGTKNNVANGQYKDAGKKIANALLADVVDYGPITQAVLKGMSTTKRNKMLAKLAIKLTPGGQFENAWGIASTGVSVGNTGYDLLNVPKEIQYDVTWDLQATDFSPKSHDPEDGGLFVTFEGVGFNKVNEVLVTDSTSGTEIRLPMATTNPNFTKGYIYIEQDWLRSVEGPLLLSLISDSGETPFEGKLDLSYNLNIEKIDPNMAYRGEQVCIEGSGFSRKNYKNLVHFQTERGDMTSRYTNSAEPNKVCVTVPFDAVSGMVQVGVDRYSGYKTSNSRYLTILGSDLFITFGDNGSVNDDTFSLAVNGRTLKTMSAPARKVGPVSVRGLKDGQHTVTLRGITAPDDVGTYYININGTNVKNITGPSVSGTDLTAGVQKAWTVTLDSAVNSYNTKSFGNTINSTFYKSDINKLQKQDNQPVELIWNE